MTDDPDYPGQTVKGDCRWPVGQLGTREYRFCGRPVLRSRCAYCEDCIARYQPFVAIDPKIDRKFMAGALKAADH